MFNTIITEIQNIQFNSIYEQPIINSIINYYTETNSLTIDNRIQLYHILRRHKKDLKNIKFNELNLISKEETNKLNNFLKLSDNNKLITEFKYNAELVELIKSIPTRQFNNKHKYWTIDITLVTIPIIEEKLYPIFKIDDIVYNYIENFKKKLDSNLILSKSHISDIEIKGIKGELRPFQKSGVEYIIDKKRVLLGDEMGLGKTIQALTSIIQLNTFPLLVICPNSLKYNWRKEVEKWSLKEYTTSIISADNFKTITNKKDNKKIKQDNNVYDTDIVIINYDIVEKLSDKLLSINFKSVIIDESHYLKNYKAKRTIAIKDLTKKIDVRLCLTGTPILNKPNELISQLTILNKLNELGGFWHYWNNYVLIDTNLLQLNEELRKVCYVRRKKEDVLKELPDKNHIIIETELDDYNEYKNAECEILKDIIFSITETRHNSNDSEYLRSILSELSENELIPENKINAIGIMLLTKYQMITISQKIKFIKEWIDEFYVNNPNKKLIVFGVHKLALKELQSYYTDKFNYYVPIITGETDIIQRQQFVDDFQSIDKINLIFLNIKAGGVGLTLTKSSDVLFIEQPWTPGEREQAEDRAHRIGQTDDKVTIYHILAKNTVDYYIYDTINDKKVITSSVNEGEVIKIKADKFKHTDVFFQKMFKI